MERAPHDPMLTAAATTTVSGRPTSSYSSNDDKASEAARLGAAETGAVVAVVAVESDDKVPLTAAADADPDADPENPAPDPAEGDGDAEEDEWDDEQEELGSCSRSPWCHAFVYSVFIAIVTFFVLLFRQRF